MLQSKLFSHTLHTAPADEVSVNAKLLTRAGFVDKLMSGSYTLLPLGFRVLVKIMAIIREELDAVGAQELLMPALHPKANWERTGRWTDPGREVMFQFQGRGDKDYGLGWSHEEIITPLAKKFIASYKDLPLALYQIQSKFRDEPRAKSGLLRGREFMMKDLYSFHASEKDMEEYYEVQSAVYTRIFNRVGLNALVVSASGGTFSKYSHEFQVLTPAGEDIILTCENEKCDFAQNREIAKVEAGSDCPKCSKKILAQRAIEVGNIFKLKTKYSQPFNVTYKDEHGADQPVYMGCYGIGVSRTLGAIAEVHHDQRGLIWPTTVAPYAVHLLALQDNKEVQQVGLKAYKVLQKVGIEVLYDDRAGISPGEKFADADLIGIPIRVVVSDKTLAKESLEVKKRGEEKVELVKINEVVAKLTQKN